MPKFICEDQKKILNPILNGDSLKDKAKYLLPLLKDDVLVTDTTVKICEDAVEVRNRVIHRSCVNLVQADIGGALIAIKSVLDKLNPRLFKPLTEKFR